MTKFKIVWLVLLLSVLYPCCAPSSGSAPTYPSFFESDIPVISVGYDDETRKTGNYESLFIFCVDDNESIYIADEVHYRVDKFDKKGNYLLSIGGVNTDTMKFPRWNTMFTVDSKENLVAFCNSEKKFLRFSKDGKELKEYDLHPDLKRFEIKRVKTGKDDTLFILGYSRQYECRLFKYDLESGRYILIHSDNNRTLPGIAVILPDFATDDTGNIYVTGTTDYRVFKYSPQCRPVGSLIKKTGRIELEQRDCYLLFQPGRIQKMQGWDEAWKNLGKSGRFLPSVFGINIDGNRLYVWTSGRDKDKRFLVDVYDLHFKWTGSSSCYNILSNNMVSIKAGKLYLPDIGSDDGDLKNAVGRFGFFNFPHKIEVFKISRGILHE